MWRLAGLNRGHPSWGVGVSVVVDSSGLGCAELCHCFVCGVGSDFVLGCVHLEHLGLLGRLPVISGPLLSVVLGGTERWEFGEDVASFFFNLAH